MARRVPDEEGSQRSSEAIRAPSPGNVACHGGYLACNVAMLAGVRKTAL